MNLIPVYEKENHYKGCSLVIAGCGPTYDKLPFDNFTEVFGPKCYVFAVNAAITRHYKNPNHFWLCNDVERIFRTTAPQFNKVINDYTKWNLVTRKCLLPGIDGNVAWRNPKQERVKQHFPWRIPKQRLKKGTVHYYNEFEDMESYCPHFEGAVEMGLWLSGVWGFDKVLLVGVDLEDFRKDDYAKHWSWKPRKEGHKKFSQMRKAFTDRRDEFPKKVYYCSEALEWVQRKCSPMGFEYIHNSKIETFGEM